MTDALLDGLLCESCGDLIDGETTGYPRKCDDCEEEY
ncbi:hypothetical protein EV213_12229 [Aureibacillus halotolerans]|uniref:YhfH-like protein n=1 Tax=Aureibacillus halotolerans TaxID=1508390 RepID=A0A4R6TRE5_9BACI|nr:hypothetical protein EV213_12229 [Aureibacillus halotolerans]